jgi:hypothetical protein
VLSIHSRRFASAVGLAPAAVELVLAAAVEKGTPMRQPLSLDPSSESLARPCFPACCRFRWKPQRLTRVYPLLAERDFMSVLLSQ